MGMSAALSTGRPSSNAASSRLGVISAARGNSSATSACTAGGSIRRAPVAEVITGSSTTCGSAWRSMACATVCTSSGECSMPIFTACTPMSLATASICAARKSGGAAWMPATPSVFCAVSTVMALMP